MQYHSKVFYFLFNTLLSKGVSKIIFQIMFLNVLLPEKKYQFTQKHFLEIFLEHQISIL